MPPSSPAPWPRSHADVIHQAQRWYDPSWVKVNEPAIADLAPHTIVPPPAGAMGEPLITGPHFEDVVEQSLVRNAINHMFWHLDPDGTFVRYEHNDLVGAQAMSSAFLAAWNNPGSPLMRARHRHQALRVSDIDAMFGPIPDARGRQRILNEVLLSNALPHWGQWLTTQVKDEQPDVFTATVAAQLADDFPEAFGDGLLKKAQLALSHIWREAHARGYPHPCRLTAFADYQIPNVLRAMGILEYRPALAAHIDAGHLVPAHSAEERAIRGASVLAVEVLAHAQDVAVADVDYWIWLRRKMPATPFHRTVTTAY